METRLISDQPEIQEIAAVVYGSGEVVRLADGRAAIVTGLKGVEIGDAVNFRTDGLYGFDCASATVIAKGAPVFWDSSANKAVPAGAALDGAEDFYLGPAAVAKANGQLFVVVDMNERVPLRPFVYEFDCEDTKDADVHTLIPAYMNPTGLLVLGWWGLVTEVFAGAGQDQGIVTLKDTEAVPNTIGTLTPSDGGADAVNDILKGATNALDAATGTAAKVVAAGKAVTGAVTQATSGAGAAGKMKVYLLAVPLA